MRATATLSPVRKGRQRLLASCAIAAGIVALAHGGPALAQVAGTGTIVSGGGTPNGVSGTTTTTTVTQAQNVINWAPTDTAPTGGDIDLLPSGSTWNFVGTGDYTVLNRFVDGGGGSLSRQIALNGTVNAYVGSTTGPRGGNIWFYNAGGILIGASGVINVGSLLLTTNDIVTTGGLFGTDGSIRFSGASGSTSAITVNGAINANVAGSPGSSYVALVAPRVVQAGAVRVDGSAAYVAAEQANIRINGGLFDIDVTVGAEGGNAITHTGTTTGPAHLDTNGNQSRIYMVAIPKNDAVTMLVSGAIGYDDALSAQVEPDGAVRLSAGYNIVGGELAAAPANATAANISAGDTLLRSDTIARASGTFAAAPTQQLPGSPTPLSSEGQFFVEGSGIFVGDTSATLSIGASQRGGADGSLIIESVNANGIAGNAAVNVSGGTLSAASLEIYADGEPQAATGGNSQGGMASLTITGGSVSAPMVVVEANGIADTGTNGIGGNGIGGNASITVSNAGSTLTASNIFINALGRGDFNFPNTPPAINGDGTGGTATLTVSNGGSVTPAALLSLDARGIGGIGLTQSGNGAGGTARIQVSGAGSSLSATQSFVDASGQGGGNAGFFQSQNGGDGTGGTAEILTDADAASTISLGSAGVFAIGEGGNAGGAENVTGGDALGGSASLIVEGGVNAQFTQITLDASAAAGTAASPSGTTGQSGNARANNVTLTATNGSTVASSGLINLFAVGMNPFPFNPAGENFGTGTGGNIAVNATAGGTISTGTRLTAQAMGGSMSDTIRQSAGNGIGGDVDFLVDGGTIRAEDYQVDASGNTANVAGAGGTAQGGTIDVFAQNGGLFVATLDANSSFNAGATTGVSAAGAAATGGTIQLIADAGTIDLGVGANLFADGSSGGAAVPGANNPTGTGGAILIRVEADASDSSRIDAGDLFASADGRAQPDGETPPGSELPAGNGQGGTMTVEVAGGTFTGGVLELSATGVGGGGAGSAAGTGGTATFTQTGGTVSVSDIGIAADGFGGTVQGVSGTGIGGIAAIDLSGGTLTAADITASASGAGGIGFAGDDFDPLDIVASGDGGLGRGGSATINIDGTAAVEASVIEASALGTGGDGGRFDSFFSGIPGDAGDAGEGIGGEATVNVRGGTTTASSLTADASGLGGVGGDSFFSSSGAPATGIGVGGTGGTGRGGTATIALETAIDGVGAASSVARGSGGAGGLHNVGGDGGDGFGGAAQAIVAGFEAGDLAVTIDSTGIGGDGADGSDGAGGSGGNGTGGTSRIAAEGAGAGLTAVQSNLVSGGSGGNGGAGGLGFSSFPAVAPDGGDGGDGQGGTIEIAANDGGIVALGLDGGSLVSFSSTGNGGAGGLGSDSSFGEGNDSGSGGDGGRGIGGTVRLTATGGTITSNGEAVDIVASGFSGEGGSGGTGQGGGRDGILGNMGPTTGGRVVIETALGASGPGQIDLGPTSIAANGDFAGRIELRAGGNISFAGLAVEAFGIAAPTNNDTDTALAGIFVAPTGGTIASQGDVALTTDGSIGIHAQSTGIVDVDGTLTIDAGDQIDIRHDMREGDGPTLRASGSLTATANSSISGAPGSMIAADGALSLTTAGAIGVDGLAGDDIILTSTGATTVEHAEAVNDFTANAASFATGLNSIITGGDINITSPGAVDLGNSSAGGFVQVSGQSIAFNAIDAGLSVGLSANGTAPGAEGIAGGSITAGGDINLFANSIALTGAVTGDASFFAFGTGGAVSVNDADVAGTVSIFATDDLSGSFIAGGNIFLNSDGNINASAQANGGYVDPNGIATEGNLFVVAAADAALTDSSAARMFGVSAAGAASIDGGSAGEDMLVIAGTTASLTDIGVGDDLIVRAPGNIDAVNVSTTGAGADTHTLDLSSGSGSPTFSIGVGDGSGADIVIASANGAIDAAALSAGDDITLTSTGATTVEHAEAVNDFTANAANFATGLTSIIAGGNIEITAPGAVDLGNSSAGGFVQVSGQSIAFNAIDAGLSVGLSADGTAPGAEGITGGSITAGGDINLSANSIALTGAVTGDDIILTSSGAATVEHAEAVNDFTANAASFATGLNSIVTGGNIEITSPGAVDLGNSSAGGFVQVSGQSIAFNAIDAGLSVGLSADGTTLGAEGISGGSIAADGDINLFGNSIALTGAVTGDASFFAFGTGGAVSVNDANVAGTISIFAADDLSGSFVAGGNIFLNSDGSIDASAQANGGYIDGNSGVAEGNLFVIAAGDAALANSTAARMFGVSAGDAASVDGGIVGEDMLVLAGTTASLTDVSVRDDVTVRAPGDIDAVNVSATGAGADTHILDFSSASGSPIFTIGVGDGGGADLVLASATGAIDAADLSAGDDILLGAATGIAVNGATTLGLGTTGGDSSIRTQGGATTLASVDAFSDLIVDAAGLANLSGVVAAGRNATINAQDVTLAALTDPDGNAVPTLSAEGDVAVNSAGGIAGGGVRALGNAALTASTAIGLTSVEGQNVTLTGATGIDVEVANVLGAASLDSSDGDIRIGNLLAAGPIDASAGAIRIEGGGNLTFATLTTDVGDAYIRANGDLSVADGNVAGTADFGAQGEGMSVGTLTATNAILANSGGFLNLDSVTVAGSLDASALASLGITGVVTGQSIALASANITISSAGRVGTAGVTQQLSVANNNSDNQTFVGGASGTSVAGYHIDADELTRLYGSQIDIVAPAVQAAGGGSVGSAAPPDVVIDGFSMTGGAAGSNLGANGALTIRTPGKMRVVGNVELTGLTDANALNLVAGDALEVILGQGSLRLVNGADPAGQLNMASDDIIVATAEAIADVGAATSTDAIDARLEQNDGILLDEGAIFARGIRAEVVGGFYVQNSGAGTDFAQRRGLTFGAGGLDVVTEGPSRIVVNGVGIGPNGQVTGLDALQLLTIGGAAPVMGGYDPQSTVNGCLISSPTVCATGALDVDNDFPVQDVIEEIEGDEDNAGDGNTLPQPLITMREVDPLTGAPLLDDPVTGAGNDDLWTPPAG